MFKYKGKTFGMYWTFYRPVKVLSLFMVLHLVDIGM